MRKEQKIKILAIAVLLMYLVSGLLLLLLALLLYKFGLSGKAVRAGVIAIYMITGMAGGIFAGKKISCGDLPPEAFILSDYFLYPCLLAEGNIRTL